MLIACISKKLHAAECNYPAHERELLALVEALKYWRVYLCGAVVEVYIDSSFLRYHKTCELNSPRQVRWVSIIEIYNVQFTHIPGTKNTAADALSRLNGAIAPILPLEPAEDWSDLYTSRDTRIAGFAPWGHDVPVTNTSFHHGKWWFDDLILGPTTKIEEVLTSYHDAITACHCGSRKLCRSCRDATSLTI